MNNKIYRNIKYTNKIYNIPTLSFRAPKPKNIVEHITFLFCISPLSLFCLCPPPFAPRATPHPLKTCTAGGGEQSTGLLYVTLTVSILQQLALEH